MATIAKIYKLVDSMGRFVQKLSFDNVGLLLGRMDQEVEKIMVTLDVTQDVADEAVAWGADLIISHHPVIFHPVKSISDQDAQGRLLLTLLQANIAVISSHTNLDIAIGGVNDALAKAVGLSRTAVLRTLEGEEHKGNYYQLGGLGRFGTLLEGDTPTLVEYVTRVKEALNANGVRYVDGGKPVYRIAVGSGASGDLIDDVIRHDCDTFITSDIKYNGFLDAKALGINLIDAGHFPTEQVICPRIVELFADNFPELDVKISEANTELPLYI